MNHQLESRFPDCGTKEELRQIGAKHLSSDEFEHEGKKVRIEYMVYEREGLTLVWKKPINSSTYFIHKEERIVRSYPVPLEI